MLKKGEKQRLSDAIFKRRKRRRAVRMLQRWWRNMVQDRILREALEISGFQGVLPADLKAELTSSELKLLHKALKDSGSRQFLRGSPGNAAHNQLKKKGVNKKLNAVLHRNLPNTPYLNVDAAEEVEALTRAAVLRSPSLSHVADMVLGEDSAEEDSHGGVGSLLGRVSRSSRRLSVRSVFTSRSSQVQTAHSPTRTSTVSMQTSSLRGIASTGKYSRHVADLARESYETMKANDRMGSICVVEKCYTLIGCQPDEHILLLGPLQQLINSERDEILEFRQMRNDMNAKKRPKEKAINDVEEERRLERELKNRRQVIVRSMREKLRLTTRQALVTYPRSQLEHVYGKLHYFESFIPQIPGDQEPIKLPLPLPRIGKEWALAQILLDIGPDSLVLCLKLLLLERSILVVSDNLQQVSMCACALIELLKPFEWASAFMPVLPRRMLDFINSPVPFIAGVSVHDFTEIEHDDRVLEAMSQGMSLLNLKTSTLHITTEKGMSDMIGLDPYLRSKLKLLVSRLQHFVENDPQSPLRNLNTFLRFGLSRRESLTLNSVCQVLEQHFTCFCGDLAVNDKAWKRYGTVDVKTNEFMFQPDWFLNPIRTDHAFHEAMVRTQLFSGYVHERREDQIEMKEIMEGELGYFIAEWVYEKWVARKRRRQLMM
jgi:hypothetical protein